MRVFAGTPAAGEGDLFDAFARKGIDVVRVPGLARGLSITGDVRALYALRSLLAEFAPDAVAVESVFAKLNMKTALKLAEVRGVVTLAATQAGVPVHSYAPREVKASVAGYGHASKAQMQQMVRATLNLSETPQPADAADALAVALCHIYSAQARARIAEATGIPDSRPPKAGIQPSR